MNARSFLGRHRVGLLLRVFANKPEYVPDRVKEMREMVSRALSIKLDGRAVFHRTDILVWADKRWSDSDCGETAEAMRDVFKDERAVTISQFGQGDLFCGILNWGVANQMRHGVSHTLIASTQVFDHMSQDNVEALLQAAGNGALAAGIATHELTELVLRGRIANTFGLWDDAALVSVGGFDLRAKKPIDDREAYYMRGWSPVLGEVYYHVAGVEEVIPLARMVAAYRPCIAPILPADESARYRVPDRVREPENYERHHKKLGTKEPHQNAHLIFAGFDHTYLEGGILPAYRQS